MKQFLSFVRKEFFHIFRDTRTMLILLGMPIALIILFGFAITTEVKEVPIAVLDYSKDEATQKITDQLIASEYFKYHSSVNTYEEAQTLFKRNKVRMVVVFPPQFAGDLLKGSNPQIQLLADATDPNEATSLVNYANIIIRTYQQELMPAQNQTKPGQVQADVKLLYNPQMKGSYNFVPGVMGLILILICAMMTSVGIVKEKEMGTMEVLLVSPLKPIYIILAKAVPYLLLSMANVVSILLLSYFLLDVPINGSIILLLSISVIYALLSLSLGLLISTITETQQAAMLVSGVALMLPVMLLSGMIFPIENMPLILQGIANIVPAKWYILAIRDVMIKGLGWIDVWQEVSVLLLMIVVLVGLSVKRFKIRLE
nr:ABC transporter permease [uncultured Macellibacteroides sp.]